YDGAVIHEDRPGRVAGDHDGVVQIIAGNRQHAGRGGKRGRDCRQNAAVQRLQRKPGPAQVAHGRRGVTAATEPFRDRTENGNRNLNGKEGIRRVKKSWSNTGRSTPRHGKPPCVAANQRSVGSLLVDSCAASRRGDVAQFTGESAKNLVPPRVVRG